MKQWLCVIVFAILYGVCLWLFVDDDPNGRGGCA
jgi:hypothetical protein